ncbi:MAG: porin [Pseudobdellovibrio sp.]
MKNILASLVLVTSSMSMAANQLMVDGRLDHKSYSPNDAVGKPGYEAFQISRLKLDYKGKLGEQNSFRVRLDGTQNTAAKQVRDNSSAFMDIAYVSHKFTDQIALTMGKLASSMGGIEGSVSSPGDMYLRTTAGDEIALVYQPTGAQADLTFGDHKVNVMMANNTNETAVLSGANLAQTRSLAGATYTGKFMENNLTAIASYHFEDFGAATGTTKYKNNYSVIGGRFVIDAFEIEADYLANKYDVDPQSTNVLGTISATILGRYNIADLGSVHLKVESTEQKTALTSTTEKKDKITGLTAAFEFKPVKDENWRMHFAMVQKDNKPETGDTKTEKFIYAGMRFNADFLK